MIKELIAQFCLVYGCEAIPPIIPPEPIQPKVIKRVAKKIPKECRPYVNTFKEVAKNASRELSLTWQESNCNPRARSSYAKGLRQFTDKTGKWASRTICSSFGVYKPYNSDWSAKCGVKYIEWLEAKTANKYPYCLNRKIAEQRYNGGAWVLWELRTAKTNSLSKAKVVCGSRLFNGRRRAGWACKENYEYPVKISKHQRAKFSDIKGTQCY